MLILAYPATGNVVKFFKKEDNMQCILYFNPNVIAVRPKGRCIQRNPIKYPASLTPEGDFKIQCIFNTEDIIEIRPDLNRATVEFAGIY